MSTLASLDGALRERGFEPSFAVRLTDMGARKIAVIKEVRTLTNWGLKQAKDAVEGLATILVEVSRERAEAAAERLEGVGASVAIELATAMLYAFDPADPRRGDQLLERARVVGLGVAFEPGTLGAWTLAPLEVHADEAELLAAIDERRRMWARQGKREASREAAVLASVAAREVELEDRLRASEGEARAREAAVYGDWLQSCGDPRGLLAAAPTPAQRERLVSEHASHLLGPARALLERVELRWCGPIVDALLLDDVRDDALAEQLDSLLAAPACACLRSLSLGVHGLGDRLAAAPCAAGLRELQLRWANGFALRGDSFARLERLTITGGTFMLGPARLPALRELDLHLEPVLAPLTGWFGELEAPALEHLRLFGRTYDYWDQNFGPLQSELLAILRQPAFARLRTLAIATNHDEDAIPMTAGLADSLAGLPAIATLERIDLSKAALRPECRAELERARTRLPGLVLPS
jgi:hypothetical protein